MATERRLTREELIIIYHCYKYGIPKSLVSDFLNVSRMTAWYQYKKLESEGVLQDKAISTVEHVLRLEGIPYEETEQA